MHRSVVIGIVLPFDCLSESKLVLMIIKIVFLSVSTISVNASVIRTSTKWSDNEEIKIFREYLRIPTVHPNVDYSKLNCVINFTAQYTEKNCV